MNPHNPQEDPSNNLNNKPTPLNRKQFLQVISVLSIFGFPAIKAAFDSELKAGIGAAIARPELPGLGERHEVSLDCLRRTYASNFHGLEFLLPEEVWVRETPTEQGNKLRGTGPYLSVLAQNSFAAERMEGQTFDDYYEKYVNDLHDLADTAGLDFVTLVGSLQISAENITGFAEPKDPSNIDVNVSRVQEVVVTGARTFGLELPLISALGPNGVVIKVKNELGNKGLNLPESIDNALPEDGIRHYDLIRFREQPTTGMMDMEPGERAEAYRTLTENPLAKLFKTEFPEVAAIYNNVSQHRDRVNATREEMRNVSNEFISQYPEALKPFAEGNEDALRAIGIAPEMDAWQLQNYTDVWFKVSEIPTNPEFAYQRTVEYMKAEAAKDPQAFYKRLFSQQIRNPRFVTFLQRQALNSGNNEQSIKLFQIQDLIAKYNQHAKDLRTAHLNALRVEGPYEYNSRFQQMTCVMVTKRLSDIAGPYEQFHRNSLAWHLYKTCAIREIAPIPFLVDDQVFARDITIDPPYAQASMARSLDEFAGMITESGMVSNPPGSDILQTYQTMEKMFWRDGGVWPEVEKGKWEMILEHFNQKLANRLFYDFAGLLMDKSRIDELNRVMSDNGLLTESYDKDPYNFFTQFVYLLLNSSHMRRDIPKEKWDEARHFFVEKILPLAITKEEEQPGVFKEKYHIGSADYPPIFRSQAVMYNFLFDLNPTSPHSTSSSEILGHH